MSDLLDTIPLFKKFHKPGMTCEEFIKVVKQKSEDGTLLIGDYELNDKDLSCYFAIGIMVYAGIDSFSTSELCRVASVVSKKWWGDYE